MKFGERFKLYRQKANLTQKEAAELIGVKDYQLGNYETDRSEPSLTTLIQMSRAYKVTVDKLIGADRIARYKPSEKENEELLKILESLKEYVQDNNK